jgi:hypothetical protein
MATHKQIIASFSVPRSEMDMFEEFKTILSHQKLSLSGALRGMIREYVIVQRESEYSNDSNEDATTFSQKSEHPLKVLPRAWINEAPQLDVEDKHEHWSVAITQ